MQLRRNRAGVYDCRSGNEHVVLGAINFTFVWKKMKGDFLLRTRVSFIGEGAVNHRKIGWMVYGQVSSRPRLTLD